MPSLRARAGISGPAFTKVACSTLLHTISMALCTSLATTSRRRGRPPSTLMPGRGTSITLVGWPPPRRSTANAKPLNGSVMHHNVPRGRHSGKEAAQRLDAIAAQPMDRVVDRAPDLADTADGSFPMTASAVPKLPLGTLGCDQAAAAIKIAITFRSWRMGRGSDMPRFVISAAREIWMASHRWMMRRRHV